MQYDVVIVGGSFAGLAAAPGLDQLKRHGIAIESGPVTGLEGMGQALSAIRLADGHSQPLDALFISPRNRLNSPLAEQIGCEIVDGPLRQVIKVDDRQMTSVEGIFAAGDISRSMHNITFACADGVMAAMAMHRSLVTER